MFMDLLPWYNEGSIHSFSRGQILHMCFGSISHFLCFCNYLNFLHHHPLSTRSFPSIFNPPQPPLPPMQGPLHSLNLRCPLATISFFLFNVRVKNYCQHCYTISFSSHSINFSTHLDMDFMSTVPTQLLKLFLLKASLVISTKDAFFCSNLFWTLNDI